MINSANSSLDHTGDLADKMLAEASRIPRLIESLAGTYRKTVSRMNELRRAGLIHAKPHYRQGKYLYLIYPMKDGERRREYIGADPGKIEKALEAVNRVHEYEVLSHELARVEGALSMGLVNLNRLVQTLSVNDDKASAIAALQSKKLSP